MVKTGYYIVNSITLYRLLAAALLIFLIIKGRADLFKWLIAISFLTDAVDGLLARRFKVMSIFGSKLDSVADDLTIVAAFTGMIVFKTEFLKQHIVVLSILFALYLFQFIFALIRYGKISNFHTYSAKTAAILQGLFFILLFFLPGPVYILFYLAVFVTAINLTEEIILVYLLPEWRTDVKGLYWIIRRKNTE